MDTFGFDEALDDMDFIVDEFEGFGNLDYQSVLTPDFLHRHLQVASLDELALLTGTDFTNAEISDTSKLDEFVTSRSEFDSFADLVDAAVLEWPQ